MSDLSNEHRVARAFSEYPELKGYVFGLLFKLSDGEELIDFIKSGTKQYYCEEMEMMTSYYEVNAGQVSYTGRYMVKVWNVYKLTRLFDRKVFQVGDETEKGVITRMVETNGSLDIFVERDGIEKDYSITDFGCDYF